MKNNLHRKFSVAWAEKLTCQTGVYLRRWVLETPIGSLRLHHWLHSDDDRAFHDHPWPFISIGLKGKYWDVSPATSNLELDPDAEVIIERMNLGKVFFRPANHKHYVLVATNGCWTLLITGTKTRRWGFWLRGAFLISYKYFYRYGNHPCD